MLHLTLKELAAKKLRLLTTAVAVMLGVAFMAGTLVLTATISKTFDGLFSEGYAGTDAYVRATSQIDTEFGTQQPRLDASLVDTIEHVDGVAAAEARSRAMPSSSMPPASRWAIPGTVRPPSARAG
jgi:putative ABC transport system permease protein